MPEVPEFACILIYIIVTTAVVCFVCVTIDFLPDLWKKIISIPFLLTIPQTSVKTLFFQFFSKVFRNYCSELAKFNIILILNTTHSPLYTSSWSLPRWRMVIMITATMLHGHHDHCHDAAWSSWSLPRCCMVIIVTATMLHGHHDHCHDGAWS